MWRYFPLVARIVDADSHGARPDHQIILMIKWIRTSRLSRKTSLFADVPHCGRRLLAGVVVLLEFRAELYFTLEVSPPPWKQCTQWAAQYEDLGQLGQDKPASG